MIWGFLIAVSLITLGFYGLGGVLFSLILYNILKLNKNRDKSEITEEIEETLDVRKIKVKTLDDTLKILNYRQILKGDDVKLKINLISLLSLNPVKENVNLIKSSLHDENEMVRILSANTLQRMEDYYIESISELEKQLEEETSEDKKAEIYFELAKFYDEYIYSSLVPYDIMDFYKKKMFDCYEKAYNLSEIKPEYSEKFIRACIRFNELEKSKKLIEKHLEIYPESFGVKVWMCDFLLKLGKINEIRNVLKSLPEEKVKSVPKIYKAYKWWIDFE